MKSLPFIRAQCGNAIPNRKKQLFYQNPKSDKLCRAFLFNMDPPPPWEVTSKRLFASAWVGLEAHFQKCTCSNKLLKLCCKFFPQDPQAIAALKKCVSIDPTNLTALMALAASYTNENYQNQACRALKEWLRVNPKYSDLVPAESLEENNAALGITSLLSR